MLESDRPGPRDLDGEGEPTDRSITRRDFSRFVVGATITSGLFAGCRPCFEPEPPHHPSEFQGPRTFTVRSKILPGQYRKLGCLLEDPDHNPFETAGNGIHYARFFITDQQSLYFMVIYDDFEMALRFLCKNAKGVDKVFSKCQGYPERGAADKEGLRKFVEDNLECVKLFYRAYDNSQAEIRDALVLRDNFLRFLQKTDGASDDELRQAYGELMKDPHLLNHDWTPDNDVEDPLTSQGDMPLVSMNSPDRVNPFTLLARVEDSKLRRLERTLELGTFATIDLGMRPLKNLPTLHFARVSIVDGNHMLFASVYDGDFIQYVEDFSTRIAKEMDKVFGACVGYPLAGSADVFAFKDFLRANQINTAAFGGNYLTRSLLQIQSSLKLSHKLFRFERHVSPRDRRMPVKLRRFLQKNQDLLT